MFYLQALSIGMSHKISWVTTLQGGESTFANRSVWSNIFTLNLLQAVKSCSQYVAFNKRRNPEIFLLSQLPQEMLYFVGTHIRRVCALYDMHSGTCVLVTDIIQVSPKLVLRFACNWLNVMFCVCLWDRNVLSISWRWRIKISNMHWLACLWRFSSL